MISENIYAPYFYIIRHIQSGKMYVGSRWVKDCYPNELLQIDGYTTSSKTVNEIIDSEGIQSFEILKIRIFATAEEAFNYETKFLRKLNCASHPMFLNKHNNSNSIFTNKNHIWCNNGVRCAMFLPNDIPTGWSIGRLILPSKGKKYYSKDNDARMFYENEQPENWILGNIKVSKEKNGQYNKPSHNKGLASYNKDGQTKYFLKDTQPEGWVLGRTYEFKQNRSNATRGENNPRYGDCGKKFYNNGDVTKLFYPGEEPNGYKLGLLRKK